LHEGRSSISQNVATGVAEGLAEYQSYQVRASRQARRRAERVRRVLGGDALRVLENHSWPRPSMESSDSGSVGSVPTGRPLRPH
jgi:hypothetical protein